MSGVAEKLVYRDQALVLTMTLISVSVGSALRPSRPVLPELFVLAAIGAVFSHAGTNLLNDYYDVKSAGHRIRHNCAVPAPPDRPRADPCAAGDVGLLRALQHGGAHRHVPHGGERVDGPDHRHGGRCGRDRLYSPSHEVQIHCPGRSRGVPHVGPPHGGGRVLRADADVEHEGPPGLHSLRCPGGAHDFRQQHPRHRPRQQPEHLYAGDPARFEKGHSCLSPAHGARLREHVLHHPLGCAHPVGVPGAFSRLWRRPCAR